MKHYSIMSDCCYLIKMYLAVDIATGEGNIGLGEFVSEFFRICIDRNIFHAIMRMDNLE